MIEASSASASRSSSTSLAPLERRHGPRACRSRARARTRIWLALLIARPDPGAETDALEREAASYLGADRVLALRSPREAFLGADRASSACAATTR